MKIQLFNWVEECNYMKSWKKITLIFLILSFILGLAGCGILRYSSDDSTALEHMEKLIATMEGDTPTDVKKLFAECVVEDDPNFDDDLALFLSYYQGKHTEIRFDAGLHSTGAIEYGKREVIISTGFLVTTDVKAYRFAFEWHVRDDFDEAKKGIWSLYIISVEEDILGYGGSGDGLYTKGIHTARSHVANYRKAVVERFKDEDVMAFMNLFSIEVRNNVLTLEENIEQIIKKLKQYKGLTLSGWDASFHTNNITESLIEFYEIAVNYQENDDVIRISMKWVVENKKEPEGIGLTSLYIKKEKNEENTWSDKYWPDLLWNEGIHFEDSTTLSA